MRYAIVAVAQQSLRLYPDMDSYKRDVERFFRLAEMKHARLLVFPQHTGLMVIPPLVEGFRTGLLKKADLSRGRYRGWWERTRTNVIRNTAKLLRADVRKELRKALNEMPDFIWQTYVDLFASLAYDYKITVVAGSGYFKDLNDGVLREIAIVFGPDGDVLGQQARVLLTEEDAEWVQPGTGWQTIDTPLGRLGILMGEEVMYPEIGRLLAYQGAHAIVAQGMARDDVHVQLLRDGLQARVTDNQVFGGLAFVVGPDPFAPEETPPYRGRSVLMAPPGMLPRRNAIIVEAGTSTAEVLLTARWDFEALKAYWAQSPIPVRRRLPVDIAGPVLAAIYSQQATLEEAIRALPPSTPKALQEEPRREEAPLPEAETPPAQEARAVDTREENPASTSTEEPTATASPAEGLSSEPEGAPQPPTAITSEEGETLTEPVPPTGLAGEQSLTGEEMPSNGVKDVTAEEPPTETAIEEADEIRVEPAQGTGASPEEREEPTADTEEEQPPLTEHEAQSAEGKVQPEPEAPEQHTQAQPNTEPQADTSSASTAAEEAFSSPTVVEPLREQETGEEVSPSIWEIVRAELQRAAQVIKNMEWGEEPSAGPPRSPAPQETSTTETPPHRHPSEGWFHQLVERARQQDTDEDTSLDEF